MTEEEIQDQVNKLIKVIQPASDKFTREELTRRVREKAREKGV